MLALPAILTLIFSHAVEPILGAIPVADFGSGIVGKLSCRLGLIGFYNDILITYISLRKVAFEVEHTIISQRFSGWQVNLKNRRRIIIVDATFQNVVPLSRIDRIISNYSLMSDAVHPT